MNGKHFLSVFELLGIADQMKVKIKSQEAAAAGTSAWRRRGRDGPVRCQPADWRAGVDFAGPVPAEFQQTLVFTAVLGAKAKEPSAANALVQY